MKKIPSDKEIFKVYDYGEIIINLNSILKVFLYHIYSLRNVKNFISFSICEFFTLCNSLNIHSIAMYAGKMKNRFHKWNLKSSSLSCQFIDI